MSKIEEALIEYFGERCSDFEPECVVCQVWKEWDELTGNNNNEKTGELEGVREKKDCPPIFIYTP